MTTLEEYFSDQVPNEIADTLCDPISYTIMVYPVFCSGRTYDRNILETSGWKDPFSGEAINPSNLQLNLAVDSSIEKFLQRHTSLFIEREIIENINSKEEDRLQIGFQNVFKLIRLLGDRKRRDTYLNASRELLSLFNNQYEPLAKFLINSERVVDDHKLFIDFLIDRSGYPSDYISEFNEKQNLKSSMLFRLLDDHPSLFQCYSPSDLVQKLQFEKLAENQKKTPFFHFLIITLVKSLKFNPIRYLSTLSFSLRCDIVNDIASSELEIAKQLTNEEADLLLQLGDDTPELPQNILSLKLRALQYSLLNDQITKLQNSIKEKNYSIQQFKYRLLVTSLLPSHNSVRFVSREDPKRCLTSSSSPIRLRCEIIANDATSKLQEWVISSISSSDGRQCYFISNPASNRAIENERGSADVGNTIIVNAKNENSSAQQWQILPIVDSFVVIRNFSANGSITFQPPNLLSLNPSVVDNTFQHFALEPF